MTSTRAAKMSPLFLALAGVTLALSSWGLFQLFTTEADMPGWLAVLAVGGLDVAAVLVGKHALTVAEDGDSSLPWNLALILLTGLAAYAQFEHARLAGDPLAIGVVSMAFPVVTVLLFEGQLRRAYRLNGRAAGRLSQPRATVDLITWVFYPGMALRATKLAVLDRGLDQNDALVVAEELRKREAARAIVVAPARRRMRRTYADILEGGRVADDTAPALAPAAADVPAIEAPVPASEPDVREEPAEAPSDVRPRGEIARAVRAAYGRHGDVLADVLADVRTIFPDVPDDTVRRTLARLTRDRASGQ